jgi:phosphoglycolate phosphatase
MAEITHVSEAPPSWPKAVVFDLDGTLIDSVTDIANALNYALDKRGLPPFTVDQVRRMIGGGVPKLVERALRAQGVSLIGMMPLASDFLRYYRANLTPNTVVYEGGRELLEKLMGQGIKLGICTNKRHDLALCTLRELDLERYFQAVVGERFGRPRKPDAAPLRYVLANLGIPSHDAVMVGDSGADAGCAKAANVRCVLVTFGYTHDAVDTLGADALIERLEDLPVRLSELAAAPA